VRLLVVDDHAIVRAGYTRLFAGLADCVIKYAASGAEALEVVRVFAPEVVILDLNMPGLSGFELLRRVRLQAAGAKILVATMYAELDYVDRAFAGGAEGYITKSAPPEEFLVALTALGRGMRYIEPSVSRKMAFRGIDQSETSATGSLRDTEILRLLADGRSLSEIADNLGVSYKTVANNCSRIKSRLGLRRTKDLLRYALEVHRAG
jgi:DNA-binding NarL/FixJ family response regulator